MLQLLINTTDATSGTGTEYPSGAPQFTPGSITFRYFNYLRHNTDLTLFFYIVKRVIKSSNETKNKSLR
jgi:hypothetical protein